MSYVVFADLFHFPSAICIQVSRLPRLRLPCRPEGQENNRYRNLNPKLSGRRQHTIINDALMGKDHEFRKPDNEKNTGIIPVGGELQGQESIKWRRR